MLALQVCLKTAYHLVMMAQAQTPMLMQWQRLRRLVLMGWLTAKLNESVRGI